MNRLTKKCSNYLPQYERETNENYYDLVYKLGQLEDIEEELGIDLITLFKALDRNNNIYVKDDNKIVEFDETLIDKRTLDKYQLYLSQGYEYMCLSFKYYGKTWALTREELENERI